MIRRLQTSVVPLLSFVLASTGCDTLLEGDVCDRAHACEIDGSDLAVRAELLDDDHFDADRDVHVFRPGEAAHLRVTLISRGTEPSLTPAALYVTDAGRESIPEIEPGERGHAVFVVPLHVPADFVGWKEIWASIRYYPDSNLGPIYNDAVPANDGMLLRIFIDSAE